MSLKHFISSCHHMYQTRIQCILMICSVEQLINHDNGDLHFFHDIKTCILLLCFKVQSYVRDPTVTRLKRNITVKDILSFSWDGIIADTMKKMPTFMTVITASLTKKSQQNLAERNLLLQSLAQYWHRYYS
jgi:hypothetical protein